MVQRQDAVREEPFRRRAPHRGTGRRRHVRAVVLGLVAGLVPLPLWAADTGGDAGSGAALGPGIQVAQFQVPTMPAPAPTGEGEAESAPAPAPLPALPSRLVYEYAYGSESEAGYRRNADLDDNLNDDFMLLQPELNGTLIYRPTDWLETTLELILEGEVLVKGDRKVLLPGGDVELRPDNGIHLLIDQANVRIHGVTDPFSFILGRRNYEDARHWLYDTSIDVGAIGFSMGRFQALASYGREIARDLDVLDLQRRDRINTAMLHGEYRATDDIKVAAYTIRRDDRTERDGWWQLTGLRSFGYPVAGLSYWADLAAVYGRDEEKRRIRGYGFDVGATYQFRGVPLVPSVTLAYAYGSGDDNPEDNTNGDFRQTGLQSNEQKFAGLSEFRYYGEALDPELSNLHILTLGVGFRPIRDTSVDLVYHRYWLDEPAEELRGTALTAEMNQDPSRRSDDLGHGLDLVIGFRNVFGIQRMGIDLRAGLFFPGDAFRNERGEDTFVGADTAAAVVAKFWF